MKIVIQRCKEASVTIDNKIYSQIALGMVLLVSFEIGDTIDDVNYCANKIAKLRIFEDENQKINKNIFDVNGQILSISQFSLYGDLIKGNRPSFTKCLDAASANELYLKFNQKLLQLGLDVSSGVFQANMDVYLINDGPLTFILESRDKK